MAVPQVTTLGFPELQAGWGWGARSAVRPWPVAAGIPALAPARTLQGETRAQVRTRHLPPDSTREQHDQERHNQHHPGRGVPASSAAAGSSLTPGDVSPVSDSPGSCNSAALVLSRGRIAGPMLSLRPSRRLAPTAVALLPGSSGRLRRRACARSPLPRLPGDGARPPLPSYLQLRVPLAQREAGSLSGQVAIATAGPKVTIPVLRSGQRFGVLFLKAHWTPFCHCKKSDPVASLGADLQEVGRVYVHLLMWRRIQHPWDTLETLPSTVPMFEGSGVFETSLSHGHLSKWIRIRPLILTGFKFKKIRFSP